MSNEQKAGKQMKEVFLTIKDKAVDNKKDLSRLITSLPDGRYLVKFERKDKRSSQQNRYMHLMFSMIQKGLYELGYREVKTTDDAKFVCKDLFLSYYIENGLGGKIKMHKRTRDLNKAEMAEFIDECIQWAAENLSVVIPSPGEQVEIFK